MTKTILIISFVIIWANYYNDSVYFYSLRIILFSPPILALYMYNHSTIFLYLYTFYFFSSPGSLSFRLVSLSSSEKAALWIPHKKSQPFIQLTSVMDQWFACERNWPKIVEKQSRQVMRSWIHTYRRTGCSGKESLRPVLPGYNGPCIPFPVPPYWNDRLPESLSASPASRCRGYIRWR